VDEGVRRLRKPEGAGALGGGKPGARCRCTVRGYAVGDKTPWEAVFEGSGARRKAVLVSRKGWLQDVLHSEGERKPMRGCRATFWGSSGVKLVEDPEGQPATVKVERRASNPMRR